MHCLLPLREDLQYITVWFLSASHAFVLKISTKKSKVLLELVPDNTQPAPEIRIHGASLKKVNKCTYIGSRLSSTDFPDKWISCRLTNASSAFQRFWTRNWKELQKTTDLALMGGNNKLNACEKWKKIIGDTLDWDKTFLGVKKIKETKLK